LVGPAGAEVALDQVRRPGRDVGGDGGAAPAAPHPAGQPHLAHQALGRAASHGHALAVELAPHLAGPVDAVVGLVHAGDVGLQLVVADATPAGPALLGRVVGGGGDLEDLADRLDPVHLAVLFDVGDYLRSRVELPDAPMSSGELF